MWKILVFAFISLILIAALLAVGLGLVLMSVVIFVQITQGDWTELNDREKIAHIVWVCISGLGVFSGGVIIAQIEEIPFILGKIILKQTKENEDGSDRKHKG